MVFSSLVFLYVFLALNLLIYCFFARTMKQKNVTMLVFSLVFYAWGGPKYLLLLLFMTAVCWLFALFIESRRSVGARKWLLALTCLIMIGLLVWFKYSGLFLSTLQGLTGFPETIPNIVLPIGISFYTFQLLSYVVDVYRGTVHAQRKYWLLLLYASLFHQCIAGPIVRYADIERELTRRRVSLDEISGGVTRFAVGLAKKAVLANTCAQLVDQFLPSGADALRQTPAADLWLGMMFFALQIYLDFSAYSDMAIGMGKMIGFHYKENFNYPYTAVSVTDFWRRWHISLSSFFRDYVYIPLGGNREGSGRTVFNLFIVWFLTGLWHGASCNFVLWGLYFFLLLFLERLVLSRALRAAPRAVSHIYLLLAVLFGWVIFYFESLPEIGVVLAGMFGLNGNGFGTFKTLVKLENHLFFIVVAVLAAAGVLKKCYEAVRRRCAQRTGLSTVLSIADAVSPTLLLILSTLALVGDSYNPFLYFRF